jgi:uncharacterized membrane protein YtjA (UPF0391 family)
MVASRVATDDLSTSGAGNFGAGSCDQGDGVGEARRLHLEETEENKDMLHYAIVFFVIALIAAFLGFSGIAAGAAGIAKILFFVFLVVAVVSLLVGRRTTI